MTAALSELYPPPGGWTTDDLDELPEYGPRHELDVYGPTGTFDKTIKIDEPWEIEIPISLITPRFYRPQGED